MKRLYVYHIKKLCGSFGVESDADWLVQTDGARGMFEKATGKNVPDKFSN